MARANTDPRRTREALQETHSDQDFNVGRNGAKNAGGHTGNRTYQQRLATAELVRKRTDNELAECHAKHEGCERQLNCCGASA